MTGLEGAVHSMRNRIKLNRRYLVPLLIFLFTGFLAYTFLVTEEDELQIDRAVDLNTGWEYEEDEAHNLLLIKRTITPDMEGKTVCFYMTDSFLDAYVDDALIYHFGQKFAFCQSPGSLFQFIEIPADSAGKELRMEISNVYDYRYRTDYTFRIGSSGSLLLELIKDEIPDFCTNIIILMLGIIMCVLYVLERYNGSKRHKNLYLGLFSIFFVIWSSCSLFIDQLVVPYGILQYYIYYFSLYLLPGFLICFLETIADEIKCRTEFFAHIFIVAALLVLQFAHIMEFTQSLGIYLAYVAVELVSIIIKTLRSQTLKRDRGLQVSFIILLTFIILNAIQYYFHLVEGASLTLSKVGLCAFLLIAIYTGMEQMLKDIAQAREARALKKIAYTDNLTGLGNRYAFDRDIKEMEFSKLCIVSLDLNNLKYYNDTFGHSCGDLLIQEASRIIKEVYGMVYRVGGDEFLALCIDSTREKQISLQQALLRKTKRYNEDASHQVILEIACGSSHYHETDKSYEDILKRADAKMYQHKQQMKLHSKLAPARSL